MNNNNEKLGQGIKFERIRRVTGYLVGTLDRWNDAKKAEEKDRVKHGFVAKRKAVQAVKTEQFDDHTVSGLLEED